MVLARVPKTRIEARTPARIALPIVEDGRDESAGCYRVCFSGTPKIATWAPDQSPDRECGPWKDTRNFRKPEELPVRDDVCTTDEDWTK